MSSEASQAFLGEEFLTWLWFRIETEGGEFDLTRDRQVGVVVDDFITFAPREEEDTEQTLRKGMPTRTVEARVALASGHRLRKAKLVVALGERMWNFTFVGATMGFSGLRVPEDDEDAESAEERSRDRVASFLEIQEIVQELYAQFLRVRLDRDYRRKEGERQAQWMATAAN